MEKQITEQQVIQNIKQGEYALKEHYAMIQKMQEMLFETTTTIETIQELQKNNGKTFIGIGSGVIIEVEAKNIKKCKRGIAEGVFIEEDCEEAIKKLKEREEKIKTQIKELEKKIAQINANLSVWVQIENAIREQKSKQITISK